MNTPTTKLALPAAPYLAPERWGTNRTRLARLLALAEARRDLLATTVLLARLIGSVPYRDADDRMWTGRVA